MFHIRMTEWVGEQKERATVVETRTQAPRKGPFPGKSGGWLVRERNAGRNGVGRDEIPCARTGK